MMIGETLPDGARWEDFGRTTLVRPIEVTDEDEREFQLAMEQYRRRSGRQFPTWSEILEVLRSLGYAKRIWKPVGVWSPLASTPVGEGENMTDALGWFARAETTIGS
jgi:hypothetical protein